MSRGRTVVPNAFTITLSSEDYDRLSVYAETLQAELAGLVKEYAEQQRYTFLGPVSTTMNLDETLDTGLFRVVSEATAAVTGRAATPAAGPTAARPAPAGGAPPRSLPQADPSP